MMIGRICILKSTGKVLEFQSDTPELGTLTKNAINAGYNAEEIDERYVGYEEWKILERRWINPSPLLEPEIIINENKVSITNGDFYYKNEKYEMEVVNKLDFFKQETKLSIEYVSPGNAQYVYDTTGKSPLSAFENGPGVTIVQIINSNITVMI